MTNTAQIIWSLNIISVLTSQVVVSTASSVLVKAAIKASLGTIHYWVSEASNSERPQPVVTLHIMTTYCTGHLIYRGLLGLFTSQTDLWPVMTDVTLSPCQLPPLSLSLYIYIYIGDWMTTINVKCCSITVTFFCDAVSKDNGGKMKHEYPPPYWGRIKPSPATLKPTKLTATYTESYHTK